MKNKFNNTSSIPTTWPLGKDRGYGWNPVRGCKNEGCHLHPKNTGECWAAKLCNLHAKPWAKHEGKFDIFKDKYLIKENEIRLQDFIPTWFDSQFKKEFPKQRSCFFVFSQTDFAFIPWEWVKKVIDRIKQNNEDRAAAGLPLHIFQFLTKCENAYSVAEWPMNCWLGITATNQSEYDERVIQMRDINNFWYVYLEPIRGPIYITSHGMPVPDWVIVGGGPDKIDPQWIRDIRDQCIILGIPFYFKGWPKKYTPVGHQYGIGSTETFIKIDKGQNNWLDGKKWEQFPKI